MDSRKKSGDVDHTPENQPPLFPNICWMVSQAFAKPFHQLSTVYSATMLWPGNHNQIGIQPAYGFHILVLLDLLSWVDKLFPHLARTMAPCWCEGCRSLGHKLCHRLAVSFNTHRTTRESCVGQMMPRWAQVTFSGSASASSSLLTAITLRIELLRQLQVEKANPLCRRQPWNGLIPGQPTPSPNVPPKK